MDSRYQRCVIVSTIMPHTVDEESRSAIHPAAYAAHEIAAHFISVLARLKGIPHDNLGKSELCADQENCRNAQTTLVFKKGFVHIPKQSRCAGDLGAFGGDLGVRVYLGQGEMTENKPHASTKRQLDMIDDGACRRAMWAFIIAVFNKRDWRVRGSSDVIILVDWYFQDGHVRLPDLTGFRGRQEFRLRRD